MTNIETDLIDSQLIALLMKQHRQLKFFWTTQFSDAIESEIKSELVQIISTSSGPPKHLHITALNTERTV